MGALSYVEPVCKDIPDRHWLLHNGETIFHEDSQVENKGLEGSICNNMVTRIIALILSYTIRKK